MKHGFEISLPGALALAGAIFYVGWISSAGYFQIAKHWDQTKELHTIETTVLPQALSIAGCQTKRADIAVGDTPAPQGEINCPRPPLPKSSIPPAASPVPRQ